MRPRDGRSPPSTTGRALDHARAQPGAIGRTTSTSRSHDVHALGFPDDTFDVVHAHQVLQHVADPVAALREMRRVCRPGGVVAVRDADYAALTWYPHLAELAEWLDLYQRHRPRQRRRARRRPSTAGLGPGGRLHRHHRHRVEPWCFATADDRALWGGMWADRMRHSAIGRQAIEDGYLSEAEVGRIADGWLRWAAAENGWFAVLHGELIARP